MERNNSTILIVDDDSLGRDTLEALLFAQGYNLSFANSGPEALAKAVELTPDVILLDVMMPGMNGFEVCQKLRAHPLLAEVPVIMITALDDQESRLEGIKAGADDFVSKPFDRMELRARIHTITRLNRYRRLLSERAKFEWVVEHVDDGYLILSDDDEILYANPQTQRYFGIPTDTQALDEFTFLAMAIKEHYQCEPPEAWEIWPTKLATEAVPRYLVQPASQTSNAFWLQVDLIEMDTELDGKYLVRLRDVTATVAEQRSRWAFHAQVSHKLRTPLSLLDGFIGLLGPGGQHLSDEEMEYFLETARKNIVELRQNILDVFQYLKARDLMKLGQGQCELSGIIDVITSISRQLGIESVNINSNISSNSDTLTYMPLSKKALELILWELLENAQKFHPNQTPALQIEILDHTSYVQIKVIDDGLTLASDQLTKMWNVYYQVEPGFTGQMPGMGLGLAMVASLIWSAGGTCRTYNQKEQAGIVIEVVLPSIKDDAGYGL